MPKTILITGATGLIGRYLTDIILKRGDEFIALTTHPESAKNKLPGAKKIVHSDDYLSLKDEKIDAVINLAGENLGGKRWNDKTKKEFYDSRIITTRNLVELISQMKVKPEVLLSASGVDYYGDTGSRDIYEDSPGGEHFLGVLCLDWELEAMKAEQYGVRVVTLRTGFVIAKNSEAVDKLIMPYKFFVGGPVGTAKQYISWIHMDDLAGIYFFALENKSVKGAVNAAAPNSETMKEFSRDIGKTMHRPAFFKVPGFVVKIIAGEMAEVVLTGRRALPKKIMELGYKFKFTNALEAWKDVL